MLRYVRNNETGYTLLEYGLFYKGMGYVLPPVKQGFTMLYEGLPSYNQAVNKQRESLLAQKASETRYYENNTTRFE